MEMKLPSNSHFNWVLERILSIQEAEHGVPRIRHEQWDKYRRLGPMEMTIDVGHRGRTEMSRGTIRTAEAWHVFNEQNILHPEASHQLFSYLSISQIVPSKCFPVAETPGSVKVCLVPVNSLRDEASQ